jgi:molybdate transport system substrate-binding protein
VRRGLGAGLLISVGLLVVGCGRSDGGGADGAEQQTLTVFAAASLSETFTELGERFEAEHEGVTVRFSFAGSSDLATQIEQGAPADVFASANPAQMARVVDAGEVVGEPVGVAANTLQIVVPPDNPAGITSLADLEGDVDVVLCAPQVPCGDAAVALAEVADLELTPVSEEPSVAAVLDKVRTGEAEAGLVYVTDVRAADGDVEGIDVPEAAEIVNVYPIAVTADDEPAPLAQDFVDLVVGAEGQAVLAEAGFEHP